MPEKMARAVSGGTAQLLHDFLAAASRRDAAAVVALCAPDVEFSPVAVGDTGKVYCGAEGIRRRLVEIDDQMPGSHAAAETVEQVGDALVASGRTHGRDMSFSWHLVMRIADGRIASWTFHRSHGEAERAAAG